jgi:voltage-gated potassium channel
MLTKIHKFAIQWCERAELLLIGLGFGYLGFYTLEILGPNQFWRDFGFIAAEVIFAIFVFDFLMNLFAQTPWKGTEGGWKGFIGRNWLLIIAVLLPMLRPLRIFKLLLVLSAVDSYGRNRTSETGFYVAVALPLIWFTGALALFDAEKDAASNFQNFGDALWWSAVTITTVGYGDYAPITVEGRVVAVFLMLISLALIGSVTALLAKWLIGSKEDAK